MIYADGAGATILEAVASDGPLGILSHATRSDTIEHAYMLWMGKSYDPGQPGDELFLKMDGHKLYEYALKTVPLVARESAREGRAGDRRHQEDPDPPGQRQNGRGHPQAPVFKICGGVYKPEIMPMIISWLGNSSVATVPTLLDLLLKGSSRTTRSPPATSSS